MDSYLILGIITHFAVNYLLLLAVNSGLQFYYGGIRCFFAALMATVFAALCVLPQLSFLNNALWRVISLGLVCAIAFGVKKTALKRYFIFCLLRFTLEGIGENQILWSVILAGGCFWVFRAETRGCGYIPVTLSYRGRSVKLKALYDTGHDLYDPVTGRHVLVVDCGVAKALTGLTADELHCPVQTVQEKAGFCLLPYHTVGNTNGMLLTINVNEATIGKRKRKTTVALCGEKLDPNDKFQGLIGGRV